METRIAIVGYGGFGSFLRRAWEGIEGVSVSTVVDERPGVIPPGIRSFRSVAEFLEDPQVEAVSLATPPSSHAEIGAALLERGLHVLVEKPLALTVEDGQRLLQAQSDSGRSATVDFMLRFNPIVQCIHRWCREGIFGALQRVVVENYAQDESLGEDHWFWNEAISGGILIEHGVHFFDIVNGCTSARATRISRRSWARAPKVVDRVYALVEYEDGLVASHYHAFNRLNQFERTSLRFVFDGAQIEVQGWIPMEGRILCLVGPDNRDALNDLPNVVAETEEPAMASRSHALAFAGSAGALPVDTLVSARFGLLESKEDAYLHALRTLMSDFLSGFRDPSYRLKVTLEDGLRALRIASGLPD